MTDIPYLEISNAPLTAHDLCDEQLPFAISHLFAVVTTFVFRQILLIILISDTFSLEFVSSPPQFFLFITFSIIGFSTSSLLAMSFMAFDNLCC